MSLELDGRTAEVLGLPTHTNESAIASSVAAMFEWRQPHVDDTVRYLVGLVKAAEDLYAQPGRRWESSEVSNYVTSRVPIPAATNVRSIEADLGLDPGQLEPSIWEAASDLAARMAPAGGFVVF